MNSKESLLQQIRDDIYAMGPDGTKVRSCMCIGRACHQRDCEAHPDYNKDAKCTNLLDIIGSKVHRA